MTKPREIVGELYFSDSEPHIIGHLRIGGIPFRTGGYAPLGSPYRSHGTADVRQARTTGRIV